MKDEKSGQLHILYLLSNFMADFDQFHKNMITQFIVMQNGRLNNESVFEIQRKLAPWLNPSDKRTDLEKKLMSDFKIIKMNTTTVEPTKKEIIERLFTQGHITFNEMWTLLQNDDVRYIPMPPDPPIINPWAPIEPWRIQHIETYCNDNDNQRVHNEGGGTCSPESH